MEQNKNNADSLRAMLDAVGGNKYTPHQGKNEKWRRAYKIYKTHHDSCICGTCQFVENAMNVQSQL